MAELKEQMLRQRDVEKYYECQHGGVCPRKAQHASPPDQASPPDLLWGWRPSDLERWARIVFPLIFLTFHLLYWTILINISERPTDDLMPLKED